MRGKEIPGPIRGENPCRDCTERFLACSDRCPKDERGEYGRNAWKSEIDRVNANRRKYEQEKSIGIRKKKGKR